MVLTAGERAESLPSLTLTAATPGATRRSAPTISGGQQVLGWRHAVELGGAMVLALPSGRRLTAIAVGMAAASVGLFWTDLRLGRSVYSALAAYHAYLEYVMLLLFVLVAGDGARAT